MIHLHLKEEVSNIKKITIFIVCFLSLLYGCSNAKEQKKNSNDNVIKSQEKIKSQEEKMKIKVEGNNITIVYELNDSQASQDLYAQLPLTIEVENYSTNEKIFYPPQDLNIENTPLANAKKGSLTYYAAWGDVVMFYDDFGEGNQLYALGEVISGKEDIKNLVDSVTISAY